MEFSHVVEKARRPLAITEDTVVLDVRSAFDFGLGHVRNAVALPAIGGSALPRDPEKAAKRLALLGLRPNTPVVILGSGERGSGEEGRLGWDLLRLGFTDVQVADVQSFRSLWTTRPSAHPENVQAWQPAPHRQMELSVRECAHIAVHPKEWQDKRVWLVDVRAPSEHLRNAAINLEWQDFYNSEGRPDAGVRSKLKALNLKPEDRLVLISAKGVLSAAAAYSLVALGYEQVQACAAGWDEILQAAARESDLLRATKK